MSNGSNEVPRPSQPVNAINSYLPRMAALRGAYAFSHEGFIHAKPAFSSSTTTLAAYAESGPTQFSQVPGFTIEAAVGWIMFNGFGGVEGRVRINKHGTAAPPFPEIEFDGSYTLEATEGVDVVYTGTINTLAKNAGPLVNYYFVAADNFRELRFMITDFQTDKSNPSTRRTFTVTGTMRRV